LVFTSFASQSGIYLGKNPGKYPGKYVECIYLKVFTFSLLANMRNLTKFDKIRTKIGNNPVGKKVNTPKGKYLGKYIFYFWH